MKIALIKDGKIENIAEWDGNAPWTPGEEYIKIDVTDIPVGIGYIHNGDKSFSAPKILPQTPPVDKRLDDLEKSVSDLTVSVSEVKSAVDAKIEPILVQKA